MNTLTVNNLLITILEFADVAMIANLIVMIIFGTYSSISKDHNYKEFNLSSGVLKMKMSTSLVGVSSIHLLQTFITSRVVTWDEFYRQCAIHMIFLFGSVSLMWVEKIYVQTENIRKSH